MTTPVGTTPLIHLVINIFDVSLGKWINTEQRTEIWDWFVSESKDFLYEQKGNGTWNRHLKISNKYYSYYLEYLQINAPPTEKVLRASTKYDTLYIRLLN